MLWPTLLITLVRKIMRVDFYWPTIETDTADYVRKCERCKKYADTPHALENKFHSLVSPWPFLCWGIDIAGPFPRALEKVKYLVMEVNYFTKWVKAETLPP